MDISQYIPFGRENAVTREYLSKITGIGERKIRCFIKLANQELSKEGKAIISSSREKGYWMTDNIDEMESYLREADHRIRTQRENDSPIRRIVSTSKDFGGD